MSRPRPRVLCVGPVLAAATVVAASLAMVCSPSLASAAPETEYSKTFEANCELAPGLLNVEGTVRITTTATGPTQVKPGEELSFHSAKATITTPAAWSTKLAKEGAIRAVGNTTNLEVDLTGTAQTEINIAKPVEYTEGLPFETPVKSGEAATFAVPGGSHAKGSTYSFGPVKITGAPGTKVKLQVGTELGFIGGRDTGNGIQSVTTGYNAEEEIAGLANHIKAGCTAPAGVVLGETPIVSALPTVESVAPAQGPALGGTAVTITGTGFTGATAVHFGATAAASFHVASSTSLTAVSPAGTGAVNVTVTTASGTSATNATDRFKYVSPPAMYVNDELKPLNLACTSGELEFCPTESVANAHSGLEPVVAWGPITLHAEGLGPSGIQCSGALQGSYFNAHENALPSAPVRAYGLIEGFSASSCASTELDSWADPGCNCQLTVGVSDEPALTAAQYRDALICTQAAVGQGRTEPSECPASSEREERLLATAAIRRGSTVPWKTEFVRGSDKAAEQVLQQRIGMAKFGECGGGESEGTELCSGAKQTSNCYAAALRSHGHEPAEPPTGCVTLTIVVPQIPVELPYAGTLEATWRNGVGSGLTPSFIELEESSSGVLAPWLIGSQGGGLGGTELATAKHLTTYTPSVKELGAEGQSLITLK